MLRGDSPFSLSWHLCQCQQEWQQDSRHVLLSQISSSKPCSAQTKPTSLQNSLEIALKWLNLDSGEQGMLPSYVIRQEESISLFCSMLGTDGGLEEKQVCNSLSHKPNGLFFFFLGTAFAIKEWLTDFRVGLWQAVSQKKTNKMRLLLQESQLTVLWPMIKSKTSSETWEILENMSIRMLYVMSLIVAQCLKTFLSLEVFESVSLPQPLTPPLPLTPPHSTSRSFHPSLSSVSLSFWEKYLCSTNWLQTFNFPTYIS